MECPEAKNKLKRTRTHSGGCTMMEKEPVEIKEHLLPVSMSLNLPSILDAAPDALVIINQKGKIVHVNAQTMTLFGYPRSELIGEMVEILLPIRYLGNIICIVKVILLIHVFDRWVLALIYMELKKMVKNFP